MNTLLDALTALAGLLLAAGVFLEFGLGWSLIVFGTYLAYITISTAKARYADQSRTPEH